MEHVGSDRRAHAAAWTIIRSQELEAGRGEEVLSPSNGSATLGEKLGPRTLSELSETVRRERTSR